jgi:hypothetical protein
VKRHDRSKPDHVRISLGPTALLVIAGAASVWLGWQFYSLQRDMELLRTRDSSLLVLVGEIIHLDEVLTMSARMAAATADPE